MQIHGKNPCYTTDFIRITKKPVIDIGPRIPQMQSA